MKKIVSIAAAAMFFVHAGAVHAATVDLTLGAMTIADPSGISYSTNNSSITGNILLLSPSPATLSLGFNSIITDTTTSQHTTPTPNVNALFGHNYLAILGSGGLGTSTFTLAGGENMFGFTWGTIDAYNTLVIKDSQGVTYTISGTDILNQLMGSTAGKTQANVKIDDTLGNIVSAELKSTQNAFEAGNFFEADSPAPLPASLPLFGIALFGLVMFARRRASART